MVSSPVMKKVKPILLLLALLFATTGGCFGPLMMGMHQMNCCESMPCAPASQSRSCCTPELPGSASHLQQTARVTAPIVAYAVTATLPHLVCLPGVLNIQLMQAGFHSYSPPGDLYTVHHSFLI
jgi:hypothetical protein